MGKLIPMGPASSKERNTETGVKEVDAEALESNLREVIETIERVYSVLRYRNPTNVSLRPIEFSILRAKNPILCVAERHPFAKAALEQINRYIYDEIVRSTSAPNSLVSIDLTVALMKVYGAIGHESGPKPAS